MKKTVPFVLFTSFFFLNYQIFGQTSPSTSPLPSQGVSPSVIIRPPMGPPPEKIGPTKANEKTEKVESRTKPVLFSFRPTFTEPGILSLRGNGFVGVDHLYNVTGNIPVVVELAKSESLSLPFTNEQLEELIVKTFQKEGVDTGLRPVNGPTLPFFHLLVMIIPSGDGISAFCAGRLFEKVELDRVYLPTGVYFQAITWEYQNLIFSPKEQSEKQISEAVLDVVGQFLSRYRYYKNITRTLE